MSDGRDDEVGEVGRESEPGRVWADGGGGEGDKHEPDEGEGDWQSFDPPGDEESPARVKRPLNSEQEKIYRREGEVFRRLARQLSLKVSRMDHHFRFNGLPAEDIFFALLMRVY